MRGCLELMWADRRVIIPSYMRHSNTYMNFYISAITCMSLIVLCGYIAIDYLIQSVCIKYNCSIMFSLKLLNSPM